MRPESLRVTLKVTQVLEQLEIPYVVCGSLASSAHGVVRIPWTAQLAVSDLLDRAV
jgi:hypothetical protein